jgi:hypothetical protein
MNDEEKNLAEKRRGARLAMGGEDFSNREKIKTEDLAARRREAQMAMESPQFKTIRLEQERMAHQREEGRRLIAEEKARHAEQLAKKQAEQTEQERQEKSRRELEHLRRQQKFEAKKNLIEDLKSETTVGLSPIRTLSNDMSRLVNHDNLGFQKTAGQQTEKNIIYRQGGEGGTNQRPNRKLALIVTLIVLPIILAGVVAFYLNQKDTTVEQVTSTPSVRPLIFSEKNISFNVAGKHSLIIYNTINSLVSVGGADNTITNLQMYFSGTSTSGQIETKNIVFSEFINLTKMNLPLDLTRYLGDKFMIGFFQGQTGPKTFIIFTVAETDYAKSWILKNEMMLLATALGPFHANKNYINELSGQKIIDVTIKNKDARLVKNKNGQTIALYSWLDQKTLLVAQDEASFTKIIDAFNTPSPAN